MSVMFWCLGMLSAQLLSSVCALFIMLLKMELELDIERCKFKLELEEQSNMWAPSTWFQSCGSWHESVSESRLWLSKALFTLNVRPLSCVGPVSSVGVPRGVVASVVSILCSSPLCVVWRVRWRSEKYERFRFLEVWLRSSVEIGLVSSVMWVWCCGREKSDFLEWSLTSS